MFLQIEIEERFQLPFKTGSHFLVFACPEHDDPTIGKNIWGTGQPAEQLPPEYWNDNRGQYSLFLFSPGTCEPTAERDSYLVHSELQFSPKHSSEDDWDTFLIGGKTPWVDTPQEWRCSCGAPMQFLCVIPENFEFKKLPEAQLQPNSFCQDYGLFLGNILYFLACKAQCNPRAVFCVMQN